jgi:spermidine synthase
MEMDAVYQGAFGPIRVRDVLGVRRLYFGERHQGGLMLGAPHACASTAYDAFHLISALRPVSERVLIIGLGAGEIPRSFWYAYRAMRIRVAEIDPVVVQVARQHFELPHDDRLEVVVGDGVEVLRESPELYDLIILDANDSGIGMPAQFREGEFIELAASRLRPGGMLATNVLGPQEGPASDGLRTFEAEAARLFPERYRLTSLGARPEQNQNVVLFLGTGPQISVDQLPAPAGFQVEA